jgi:hypothetical protein
MFLRIYDLSPHLTIHYWGEVFSIHSHGPYLVPGQER